MLTTEKCFEILPYAADIFEKLDIFTFIKENQVTTTIPNKVFIEKAATESGAKLMVYILRNINKIKEEALNIVAILQEKDLAEVRKQPIGETLKIFKEVIGNKEALDFFKSAMK